MKNIAKHIIATVALAAGVFTFGTSAFAQNDEINVRYDKTVSPKPDENGVYTISLEAYVTGSVTVTTETAPADLILVLDYSGSMSNDINELKKATMEFVDTIQDSNDSVKEDKYGKHRVGFVLFSTNVKTGTGLNTLIPADDLLTEVTESWWSTDYHIYYGTGMNRSDVIGYSANGRTNTPAAIEKAKDILNSVDYSNTNRSRVVLVFTDGVPQVGSDLTGTTIQRDMNKTLEQSDAIKNSPDHSATIYTVGLFSGKDENTADAITTFMRYISSDEPSGKTIGQVTYKTGACSITNPSDNLPVTQDKSIIVSNSSALANVFTSIADSQGGNYDAASSSSLLVDVVTQSFTVSTAANLGKAQVFAVPCTKQSATAILSFDKVKESYKLETVDSPDNIPEGKVYLGVDPETGEVKVSGFNYGAEWCGWDGKENKAHGRKLVLQIPITVNEDAVGGPSVVTNTSDSKLILKSADGEEIGSYELPKPDLKIPVSIWIEKHGLVEDDSAVFTLARAPYVKGASYDEYVTGKYKDSWESFTKIIVNEKNMQTITVDGVEHKVVKISGLDPDYYYRIKEDAWAWGYPVQIDGIQYTIGDNLKNPLQVWNQPNPDAPKHAESVVRNVFTERTTNWSE